MGSLRPRRRRRADGESQSPSADRRARRGRGRRTLSPGRLRRILDGVADGVIVADAAGRLILQNTAARGMLGLGLLEVPPSEWPAAYGCFRPDGMTLFRAEDLPLARALRGETVRDAEMLIRNSGVPDGVWLSVNAAPLADRHGRVEGGVAVFRDVTVERRERQRAELLSNVVEQTADGVLVTDAGGRIQYVNPAFERITGYPREELIGRTPQMLGSGRHDEVFYAGLWRTLMAGEVFFGTISDRRRSGELFLAEQTITPMRGRQGAIEHLVSVVRDVTELQRAAQHESSLQVARGVQQRLYPAQAPRWPGLDLHGEAFVADVTGGDYFDFVPLPGDLLGLAIGDVSGHGIDSALVMAEMRAILRSTARTLGDPGEILSVVNQGLVADTEDSRFATLFLAALDPARRTLRYASAGHPPGFVLGADGAVRAHLGATSPPLGLFDEASFRSRDGLTLHPGDTLVLYTDGVTESESAERACFGVDRLIEVVRSRRGAPASSLVAAIQAAVRAFVDQAPPQDDVTVLVCGVVDG